jgi:hypothetical protein
MNFTTEAMYIQITPTEVETFIVLNEKLKLYIFCCSYEMMIAAAAAVFQIVAAMTKGYSNIGNSF